MLVYNYLNEIDDVNAVAIKTKHFNKLAFYDCVYCFIKRKKWEVYPLKLTKNKPLFRWLLTNKVYSSSSFKSNSLFFYLYYQHYFSTMLKLTITLTLVNSRDIVPKDLIYYAVHSVKAVRWKRYYIMHSNEIIEALFIALWLKNVKLFMKWMRAYFENMNLKKHKKLFLLLKLLLGKLIWNYNIFLQLKGLRLVLRGKFGKAGSVRKSRRYIRKGKCSYTSKNIASINQHIVIRTLTGVFAIKFEVFF